MEKHDALSLVFIRNAFNRRMYILTLVAFLISLGLNALLGFFLIFMLEKPVSPVYFATDDVSRLIDIIPVSVPNMKIEEVIAWTVDAVEKSYSFDYINYRAEIQSLQKYYTQYGWSNFMKGLVASNNINGILKYKIFATAQVVGPPKILAQGLLSGAYAWKFQLPVLITYAAAPFDDKNKYVNAATVTVLVQRQPILQSYKGLGVVQFIGTLAKANNGPQEISNLPT